MHPPYLLLPDLYVASLAGSVRPVSDYVFISVFRMHQLVNQFTRWRPKTILA